ncbi:MULTISPECIES: fimbrial protein YehD [unclassified Pseudocitrobacter]|uniref:fimbrial protein YehD n=1 Tax=unclassified Pseudocitrobacter TaxID=2638778 RepID=UPI0023E3DF6D|nr:MULTISPECIES: fimbrial protein YehD [unclassified Pseudocitrobacter]MDF3828269.1 fimbrial protein YehD [Pseudocitrobacter sp. 2023EL-00150]MEC5374424.1 fimbrial protein YehD [Pseudocitrobacter sp. MW920760]
MMKHSILTIAVFSSLLASSAVFAADDEGVLQINGKVLGSTCKIEDGKNQATITMPDVSVEAFSGLNAGEELKAYSSSAVGQIKFKCDQNVAPRISFSVDGFNGSGSDVTKNTSGDNGVGFKVHMNNETKAISPQKSMTLVKDSSGIYTLDFSAFYARTSGDVKSGEVNSSITMQVFSD